MTRVIRAKNLEASGKLGWVRISSDLLYEIKVLASIRRITIRTLVDQALRKELQNAFIEGEGMR